MKLLLIFGSKITKHGVNKQLGDIRVDMYIFYIQSVIKCLV